MVMGIVFTLIMLALVPLKPIWKPKLLALFESASSGAGVGGCELASSEQPCGCTLAGMTDASSQRACNYDRRVTDSVAFVTAFSFLLSFFSFLPSSRTVRAARPRAVFWYYHFETFCVPGDFLNEQCY